MLHVMTALRQADPHAQLFMKRQKLTLVSIIVVPG